MPLGGAPHKLVELPLSAIRTNPDKATFKPGGEIGSIFVAPHKSHAQGTPETCPCEQCSSLGGRWREGGAFSHAERVRKRTDVCWMEKPSSVQRGYHLWVRPRRCWRFLRRETGRFLRLVAQWVTDPVSGNLHPAPQSVGRE
jgi:hypothetical protein